MIHFIRGQLVMKLPGQVVVEAGGIGYEINVPDNAAVYLSEEGETVRVYTVMMVREDDVSLYGFSDRESLSLFRKLLTVSGVGAKAGLAVLSAMPLQELRRAIIFEDAATLTRANGIGKKTASRIVLELKDKLGEFEGKAELADRAEEILASEPRAEAISALVALGYSKGEAMSAVAGVSEEALSAEEYIRNALKRLF